MAIGLRQVTTQSTSVSWIPAYEVLERAGLRVPLVSPNMARRISGRKSDMLDCQWIRQLLSDGLLCGSFRRADALFPFRSLVRHYR